MSCLDRLLQGRGRRRTHRGSVCACFHVSAGGIRNDDVTWASGAGINLIARLDADGVVGRKISLEAKEVCNSTGIERRESPDVLAAKITAHAVRADNGEPSRVSKLGTCPAKIVDLQPTARAQPRKPNATWAMPPLLLVYECGVTKGPARPSCFDCKTQGNR